MGFDGVASSRKDVGCWLGRSIGSLMDFGIEMVDEPESKPIASEEEEEDGDTDEEGGVPIPTMDDCPGTTLESCDLNSWMESNTDDEGKPTVQRSATGGKDDGGQRVTVEPISADEMESGDEDEGMLIESLSDEEEEE